jgi:hypothetical protein
MNSLKLFTGKLNLDDHIDVLPEGDYTYMIDGVVGVSVDGKRGTVENMMGTSIIAATADMAGGKCIGGARDLKTNSYFLFFYNADPSKHTIVKLQNNVLSKVMTWSGLNFSLSYKITGVAFVNGYLYFSDNLNGIRGFDITKYTSSAPTKEEEIALMKRGAIYAAEFEKQTDVDVPVNLISSKDFQFTYQYVYNDDQLSVLAPYSYLCQRNTPTQTYNKVVVEVPVAESIPADVKEIKFAVRVGNTSAFQYIGTLKRSTDNFATRSLDFFNTVYGGQVQVDYQFLFHDVPLKAKALEFIKNRLWLGNFTTGYNTPASPNLSLMTTVVENANVGDPILTSGVTLYKVRQWQYSASNDGSGGTNWSLLGDPAGLEVVGTTLIDASNQPDQKSVTGKKVSLVSGAYEITDDPYSLNGDLPITAYGLKPIGTLESLNSPTPSPEGTYTVYRLDPITTTGTLRTFVTEEDIDIYNGSKTFPNNSSYKAALIYKDKFGRSAGVVLANQDIDTASSVYSNRITVAWTLPSGVNLNIPDWADTYHLAITKNLTKSYFFEWKAVRTKYYKDATLSDTYSVDNTGIKIDLTPMVNIGLGYTWKEGDRVVIYKPDGTNSYNLPIKSFTEGQLILPNVNIGTITTQTPVIEVYRPSVVSEELFFYEIAQGYAITNAGTSTRAFSTVSGTIEGDCFNVLLDTYTYSGSAYVAGTGTLVKEMSLDVSSADWNTDAGKPHIEDSIGQVVRPYTFKHSAPIIDGSQTNGLSEFYPADEGNVPFENGEIFKLKSSTRTASDGTVLLAICRNRVSSIYVDESRVNIDSSTTYLVNGSQIIGDINTLNGWYGTVHPESVIDDGTYTYWYSKPRRSFVRYSTNGIFPVSEYKVTDYFEKQSAAHAETDTIAVGYFPFYDIVVGTFPNAASGYKTISYREKNEGWMGFHSFTADFYLDLNESLYSVKNDVVYIHNNKTTYGSFQGTAYDTKISSPCNPAGDTPKVWQVAQLFVSPAFISWANGDQILAEDSLKVELSNGNGQFTDVLYNEFEVDEYVAYAPFKADMNSTGGITDGDEMCSRTATATVVFGGVDFRYISMFKIGFIPSLGHAL